jgi:hypothetical protein
MKPSIIPLITLMLTLAGCVTSPDGGLSTEGQLALQTSVRIAMRHAVADSPRAAEKAANIRAIVVRLHTVASAESTLAALRAEVITELDKLNLTPVERADAEDLLTLLAVALESRLGPDALQSAGLVRVREFLDLLLVSIPAV